MKIQNYKELIVWRKSFQLSLEVYKITKSFPKEELYGLTSQMRRAAIAIPSNIAEGHGRRGTKEYVRFLRIAYASATELETQLLIAKETDMLGENDFEKVNGLLTEVLKMLNVLIVKLKNPIPNTSNPSRP